ncbi:MAG: hypothetical protein AB7I19_13615 [Planctomycetota bacterium]
MIKTSLSRQEQLQKIIHEYQQAHGGSEYEIIAVVEWALATNRIDPPKHDLVKLLARDFRKAARNEYITDDQGREVRRNHPRPVEVPGEIRQKYLWDDIRTAKPEHMRMSFSWRRKGVLADVVQLKTDFDSYNDNNRFKVQLLPLDFNFNQDLAELEQSTEYPELPTNIEEDSKI